MTKIDKLQDKLLRKPTDMRFDEIRAILKSHGFENVRTKGSHFLFTNNKNVISIPVHGNTVKKSTLKEL